jgi:N-acetylglutamate synthase/N-acetylornithine aminotransferase
MTTTSDLPIPAPSADLPPVERRPVIPAGFKAGGLAAGIKASGRPDRPRIHTTTGAAAAAARINPVT